MQYSRIGKILLSSLAALTLVGCSNGTESTETKDSDSEATTSSSAEKEVAVEVEWAETADVLAAIESKDYVFVDTRNDSYYNGYTDPNQDVNGHIAGAVQYTSEWVDNVNQTKLEKYVSDKGITPDKNIIVYDSEAGRVEDVVGMLNSLGYENVQGFKELEALKTEDAAAFEQLENFTWTVNADWVNELISGGKPETYENDKYKVFEVSWGDLDVAEGYKAGHIPGAYHFNTDWIEEGPVWNMSSPEKMQANLEKAGITTDTTVVIYSEDASAGYRVLYALTWAGVEDVRVLNGGLPVWEAAGYELETKVNEPEAVESFGATVPVNPQINIQHAKEAHELQGSEGLTLVSNRSWQEYTGEISGYDYIERKGEPVDAVWGFSGSDASNLDDFYDPDGTMRNPNELVPLWESQGISAEDKIAFYCGTGWRSTVPWTMTQMLGWENVRMYDGGWNDWQMDKELPILELSSSVKKPDSKNDFR